MALAVLPKVLHRQRVRRTSISSCSLPIPAFRRVSGRNVYGRHIFHFRPNEWIVTSSPANQPWAFGIVTAPFERLAAYHSEATGFDHEVLLDDDSMFVGPEVGMALLVALMADMSRPAHEAPSTIAEPQPARALSGTILDVLVGCLMQGVRRDRAALVRIARS